MSVQHRIDDRQLDIESGRLLRAYSAEYRRAKHYRGIRFVVSGVLAITGPVVSLWSLTAAGVVGAAAGAWVLITRLVVVRAERSRVGCAVRIQERFDTRLFDLPWPSSIAGIEPSEEDIADAARRLKDDERLTRQHSEGWYPSTDGLPWPVDVLVAQWSSAAYGRRQHASYFRFVTTAVATTVVGAIVFGIVIEMTLTDWLITFLLPALPALLDITELADAHRRLASDKEAIEARLLRFWNQELASKGTLSGQDCRSIQDDSFKLRAGGLQVPDWFFWLHRDRNEANMREAAEARRKQYASA
jgi:MFS family permease